MSESRGVIQNIAHGREMDVKKQFFWRNVFQIVVCWCLDLVVRLLACIIFESLFAIRRLYNVK
jgi:hypothetical protein